ncbi:MAG: DUF4339 domain-containing protein [Chitinophagaceae bacterium]|nr:MAG: DUF4339 domain-containing protein [Chitinophagaceae bacterium]
MNKYLLLRDNKESGPYTLAELVEKGIKAYDLVWLEGRSAAWRYPSEIDELKRYSPIVEEQPYDRFYKKAESTPDGKTIPRKTAKPLEVYEPIQMPVAAEQQTPHAGQSHLDQYRPRVQGPAVSEPASAVDPIVIIAKHPKVSITLPASERTRSRSISPASPVINTAVASIPDVMQDVSVTPRGQHYRKAVIANELPTKEPVALVDEHPLHLQEPRDARSELSNARRTNKPVAARTAVAAVTALCLLLGGVVIGLAISNSNNKNAELDALVRAIQERQNSAATTTPPGTVPTLLATQDNESDKTDKKVVDDLPKDPSAFAEPGSKPPVAQPAVTETVQAQNNINQASVAVEASNTVMREPVTTPPAEQIEAARRNIGKKVTLEASEYKIGVLGGISGLELVVYNNSPFDLEQVVAEVEYLGPEKRIVKRQSIVFNNVKAGQQRVQEVPRTNRGVSIGYSIKSIAPGKYQSISSNL